MMMMLKDADVERISLSSQDLTPKIGEQGAVARDINLPRPT
jgi:hypothetical protein